MDLRGIKNIIFDFGGVLVNLNQQACIDALTRLGVTHITDYLTPFGHRGPFGRFENGDIDLLGFRAEVRDTFRLSSQVSDDEIDAAWAAFLEDIPYRKMKWVYALSRRYRVFLLSNTNPIHIRSLNQFDRAGYPLKDCFEKCYYSFEIGHSKPGKEIFEYVMNDAGICAEETLLVDDGPANCATAQEMGLKVYCPQTSSDFMEDVFSQDAIDLFNNVEDKPFQECVATMGFFDGVHKGHLFLIDTLKDLARQKKMPSLVLSFWPHPRKVIQTDYCPQLLTTLPEKQLLLERSGADKTILMTFDKLLANLSAYDFMKNVLQQQYHVKCLLIGYDHHFGQGRKDDFPDYQRYAQSLGMEVVMANPYSMPNRQVVSSSCVRRFLMDGKVEEANAALGYDYTMVGNVVNGFGNGHKLGFPTANIVLSDACKLIPRTGSYAVKVHLKDRSYWGMLNIGTRPTLHNGESRSIEVYILDFSGEIYGQELSISFKKYLREEKTFPTVEALAAQLNEDRNAIVRMSKME